MATLPLDIFSVIIEQLDANIHDELETLKALSLTYHVLLPICQKIIFRHIDFRSRERNVTTHITKFDSLLISSPHLASYVLSLSYFGHHEDLEHTSSAMGRILSSLTRLRSLHLSLLPAGIPWMDEWKLEWMHGGEGWYFDWSTLLDNPSAADFCDAIDKVLRSDHLVHLHIRNMKNFLFSSFVDKGQLLDITEDGPLSIELQIAIPVTGKLSPQSYLKPQNYSLRTRELPVRKMLEVTVGDHIYLCSSKSGIPPLDLSSTKVALIRVDSLINVKAEQVLRCAQALEQLSYEGVHQTSYSSNLTLFLLIKPLPF